MEGKWLSILEYASFKKKSISTVRRYVKANRVKHKEENGKYYVWTKNFVSNESSTDRESLEIKFENERLKKEVRKLSEELAESKMLINIYEQEKQVISRPKLPSLPEIPCVL